MTAISRVLLLLIPLVLAATTGGMYTPPEKHPDNSRRHTSTNMPVTALPPLPAWAKASLPDFTRYQGTAERKRAFFSFLYPRIVLANSRILLEREYLDFLAGKGTLTDRELAWLSEHASRLRIEEENGSDAQFALLRKRLDVIPPSLILAQAANESAWGTSRFAVEGNNLFGQWCFTRGCGLVPLNRADRADHEVAVFASPFQSVRAYIQNLNRHPAYQQVRDIRQQDRLAGRALSGTDLAAGLLAYSERGAEYIEEIRTMIRHNNLEFYDKEFRALLGVRTADAFLRLASARAGTTLLPDADDDTTPFEG